MIAKLVSRKLVRQVGQSSIAPSILAGLAFFVGTNDILAQQTPATAGIAPPYKSLRYDENYSYLRDPTKRSDLWDPAFGERRRTTLSIRR